MQQQDKKGERTNILQEKTIKTEQQKTVEPYRKGRVKAHGIVSTIAGFGFYVKGILFSQLVHVAGEG